MRVAIVLPLLLLARAAHADCDDTEPPPPAHDQLTLTKATFADLPGWKDEHPADAVTSFLQSCARIGELADSDPVGADGHGGLAKNWRRACAAAARLKPGDDTAARSFFEAEFQPWLAAGKTGPVGKLTGYYVQEMRGSRTQHGPFKYAVYARPADLVEVDLTPFIRDAHARRIWGKLDAATGSVVPYFTREEIRKGALAGKGLELMYVDDAVDLLFAQIEGSAKVKMVDGSTVWLEFAGKNGRAYKGVGAALSATRELKPGEGTMIGIRKWFNAHASRFDEIVDQNASYVFFKASKEPGAVGSEKVTLTARRSMAIDRAFIAHGTPIWVDARAPNIGKSGTSPWQHLLIAQDTGGGILGAVRGDIYWGDDRDAEELGSRMGGPGRYWLLLPKGVTK